MNSKHLDTFMDDKKKFWIFGSLQTLTLGALIYLLFRSLNMTAGINTIGTDTQIVLSILFPVLLLATEYMIYTKDWSGPYLPWKRD